MSQELVNYFQGTENAKALGGFTSRLAIGEHTVLIKRFGVKESAKGKGRIVEADFHVLESTSGNPNETKGWAWFIGSPGWAGQYEESRLKQFFETVASSIGDTSPIAVIGAGLAGPAQLGRGLMLKCTVSAQTNRDGSPKKNPKGEIYTEITWHVISQKLEDIQQARSLLDKGGGAAPAPAATQATQPAQTTQSTVAAQPAPGGGMSSLLAALKK